MMTKKIMKKTIFIIISFAVLLIILVGLITLNFRSNEIAYAKSNELFKFEDNDGKFTAPLIYEYEGNYQNCVNEAPKIYFRLDKSDYTYFTFIGKVKVERDNNIIHSSTYAFSLGSNRTEGDKEEIITWGDKDEMLTTGHLKVNNKSGNYKITITEVELRTGIFSTLKKSWDATYSISFTIDRTSPEIKFLGLNNTYLHFDISNTYLYIV